MTAGDSAGLSKLFQAGVQQFGLAQFLDRLKRGATAPPGDAAGAGPSGPGPGTSDSLAISNPAMAQSIADALGGPVGKIGATAAKFGLSALGLGIMNPVLGLGLPIAVQSILDTLANPGLAMGVDPGQLGIGNPGNMGQPGVPFGTTVPGISNTTNFGAGVDPGTGIGGVGSEGNPGNTGMGEAGTSGGSGQSSPGASGDPGDAYGRGGTVRRTGLARVHRGEEVIRGSQAQRIRPALREINKPGISGFERLLVDHRRR